MIANSDEIVLRQPPVASKMTILPSQILPDPDLQVSPFKKGILRKEANRPKSHSNVRFNLKSHPLTDLSSSSSTDAAADLCRSIDMPAESSSSSGDGDYDDSRVATTAESPHTSQEPSFHTDASHPADHCPVNDASLIPLNSSQHILHKIHVLAQKDESHLIKELQRQLNIDKKKEISEKVSAKYSCCCHCCSCLAKLLLLRINILWHWLLLFRF